MGNFTNGMHLTASKIHLGCETRVGKSMQTHPEPVSQVMRGGSGTEQRQQDTDEKSGPHTGLGTPWSMGIFFQRILQFLQ